MVKTGKERSVCKQGVINPLNKSKEYQTKTKNPSCRKKNDG